MSSPEKSTLTTRQGHPVHNNQQLRTVGSRGPATLENYHFLEKISHFDRERIPERVVHARGFVAHGEFEAYGTIGDEPASTYTRAKLFQTKGKKTPVSVRFSTVIGGRDSSEATRDPRGFAVKFRTEDGNWDLVGNNLPVFFIRDAIKFPDVIHAVPERREGRRRCPLPCLSDTRVPFRPRRVRNGPCEMSGSACGADYVSCRRRRRPAVASSGGSRAAGGLGAVLPQPPGEV
jgi:catalase